MFSTLVYVLTTSCLLANGVSAASNSYPAGALLPRLEPHQAKNKAWNEARSIFKPRSEAAGAASFIKASSRLPGKALHGAPRKLAVRVPATLRARQTGNDICGDSGYSVCASGDMCCPNETTCCSTGDCCAQGYNCCPAGDCCPETHDCVAVGGISGCCPKGKKCGTNGTACADPGYELCKGESFCCKPGDTCQRDPSGKASCGKQGEEVNLPSISIPITTATTGRTATATTTKSAGGNNNTGGNNDDDDSGDDDENDRNTRTVTRTTSTTAPNGGIPTTMSGVFGAPVGAPVAAQSVRPTPSASAAPLDLPSGNGADETAWSRGLAVIAAGALIIAHPSLLGW